METDTCPGKTTVYSHIGALLKHQIPIDSQFQLSASHITKHFKIVFEWQGVTGVSSARSPGERGTRGPAVAYMQFL